METNHQSPTRQISTSDLFFAILCAVIGVAGFSYLLAILPGIDESTLDPTRTCITGIWKVGLIFTHALNFVLIPVAMSVFYQGLTNLGYPSKAISSSQLGLAFVMVAIAAEMGWHVTQCWYYQNDFTMLNFMFYFFLILSFSLWSNSLIDRTTISKKIINLLSVLSLLLVSMMYLLGYENSNHHFKIPIYIVLILVFGSLSYRGYKLLQDWRAILVPFFSIGVNLTFIFFLNKFGGNPYTNPQETLNALFHILHDLCGTEAGIVIFTYLVYRKFSGINNSAIA